MTMTDLTPEYLAELERLADAATPGEWDVVYYNGSTFLYADNKGTQLARFTIASQNEAEFCAAARA